MTRWIELNKPCSWITALIVLGVYLAPRHPTAEYPAHDPQSAAAVPSFHSRATVFSEDQQASISRTQQCLRPESTVINGMIQHEVIGRLGSGLWAPGSVERRSGLWVQGSGEEHGEVSKGRGQGQVFFKRIRPILIYSARIALRALRNDHLNRSNDQSGLRSAPYAGRAVAVLQRNRQQTQRPHQLAEHALSPSAPSPRPATPSLFFRAPSPEPSAKTRFSSQWRWCGLWLRWLQSRGPPMWSTHFCDLRPRDRVPGDGLRKAFVFRESLSSGVAVFVAGVVRENRLRIHEPS